MPPCQRQNGITTDTGRIRRDTAPETQKEPPKPQVPVLFRCADVSGLFPFRAGDHVERHTLIFLQRLEARTLNCGEVGKEIFTATIGRNETITLGVIEPLHYTCCHVLYFLKN